MEIAVVGGDARFAYLARILRSEGRDARWISDAPCDVQRVPRAEIGDLAEAKRVLMNWPTTCEGRCGEDIVKTLASGTTAFFCGPAFPESEPNGGVRAVDLWADEQLQAENAWLTAEGAISAAMRNNARALCGCPCMVIGWGRIGRALTEILIGMRARVCVVSRTEQGRCGAISQGAEAIGPEELKRVLPEMQVVFSTPPRRVLDEENLLYIDAAARIIDLASTPYGLDLEKAQAMGLNAWREPKLPGRYCPYSAALALRRALARAEEDLYGKN